MNALAYFFFILAFAKTALTAVPKDVGAEDSDNNGTTTDSTVDGPTAGVYDAVSAPEFATSSHLQFGLGCFALLSALLGLGGLVFRVPCLLRVTAGLYAAYLVVLTVPVVFFARTALQAFFSEQGSEWAWFYLLGLLFAIIFIAHGCMVMLKARRETMNPKEKVEQLTREEQWW